ncbi:hypothetical protein ACIOJE_27530 [Kitasatospora sp. NPDC087861]|uniref:hypothetical protein n=1 Tax=Kitasatospora sp. NPDC087861 TaxID=3364070 RepID=UPI003830F288
MEHPVVPAERGGPGKSVHTEADRRQPPRGMPETIGAVGFFVSTAYAGLVVLSHGLHLTGSAMWAAGSGIVVFCALFALLAWRRRPDRTPPMQAVDLDGAGDGQR